ncbi:MAG: glutamate-5-semialdehyde dehydrogenase [DPANN group archaeon]|nr:glutamate-5-semialdehyde dehydrogenase [DPANN group archaeon]
MADQELKSGMKRIAHAARMAAQSIADLPTEEKHRLLKSIQKQLKERQQEITGENAKDLESGKQKGLSKAVLDRIRLDGKRIQRICEGIEGIIALPDPLGEVMEERTLRSGIRLKKVRVPLGVILLIFEARPNVVIDAFALCFKSGNVSILKGGSDAAHSNVILARIITDALKDAHITPDALQLVASRDHEAVDHLLDLEEDIDLVIPRGGERLIRNVVKKARMPVIMHYKGLCHTYIDKDADIGQAVAIALNAKIQRPGVCNAMETLLVHQDIADKVLPLLAAGLKEAGVRIKGDDQVCALVKDAEPASEEDWSTEYLDLILSIRIVRDLDEAIAHINRYGSKHSEAIISENKDAQERFARMVDASSVFVNCSTRFNDGFEYGLGAEIGISTQKIHARGPMGLRELTTYKYILSGEGQVRT